jgi:hypothetical protein
MPKKSPILSSLVEIRRECALGKINTAAVKDRVEIALMGLRASDLA